MLLVVLGLRELAEGLLGLVHLVVGGVASRSHNGVCFLPLNRLHMLASMVQIPAVPVHFHQLARLLADLERHRIKGLHILNEVVVLGSLIARKLLD